MENIEKDMRPNPYGSEEERRKTEEFGRNIAENMVKNLNENMTPNTEPQDTKPAE